MPEVTFSQGDAGPVLDNGVLRVSVHLNHGTFTIEDSAGRAIREASTAVLLTGGSTYSSRGASLELLGVVPDGDGVTVRLTRGSANGDTGLRLAIKLLNDAPHALIHSEVTNTSASPLRIHALHVLEGGLVSLAGSVSSWRFYKQGWQSWSPTLVLRCDGEDLDMAAPVIGPRTRPEPHSGLFVSEMMTVVATPGGGLLTGFVTGAEQLSQVWLDRESGSLTAASYADGVSLAPGARMSSETLMVAPCAEPLDAMCRYGDVLATRMDALPYETVTSGWCSWYQYFQGVSEAEVLKNLDELTARRDELPVEYVQIDDGYQADIGDWLTMNDKFPHGMRWLVDRIHTASYKAGLWLAPFLVGANSRLFAEHPDWVVQHAPGQPYVAMQNWGQDCYAIDLTHSDVIIWLTRVFNTVCDDWGFDYVKIDFVYAGAVDAVRHDPDVTRAQAYRRGLETIREAVGSRFILGCGNPIGPSIGLIDGSRIGPDVAPYWRPYRFRPEDARSSMSEPSCLNSIRNTLTRFWMHGRLWMNDPDCLLVRATDTALTGDEVRCLATVIVLTGGMVLDSDDLTKLDSTRRDIFSMLLPIYGKSGLPVDLFESEIPERLELGCATHTMLAVFNWDDATDTRRVALPATPSHVYDVWQGKYLGSVSGSLDLEVPPHGCRLLSLRPPAGRPQVVGTTFHLLQGALEVASETWDGQRLTLTMRPVAKKHGEFLLHVPDGFGRPAADGIEVADRGGGTYALTLTLDAPRALAVSFGS